MVTMRCARRHKCASGFTLIEMIVVMALVGLLMSLAVPQYMATLERGREQVLLQNLSTMREALDKFYADRGRYPDRLEDLVTLRYLRAIPNDPYSEQPNWLVVAPKDANKGGVMDVQSTGLDTNGDIRRTRSNETSNSPMVQQEGGELRLSGPAASAADTGGRP